MSSPKNNDLPPPADPPPRPQSPPLSRSQLAAALAESYREVESLKHALSDAERRAEHFEHLVNTFQGASTDSERAIQELKSWEKRARDAELARDDELARRVVIKDLWQQLKDYLRVIDECALDARMGFDKIIEAGGGDLVVKPVPGLTEMEVSPRLYRTHRSSSNARLFAMPPLPPLGRVRPRTDSVDGAYGQPPSKRSRYQHPDYPEGSSSAMFPLTQVSHHHPRHRDRRHHSPGRHPRHSRSSSRSSNDSVDEMLLQASTESTNGNTSGIPPPHQVSYIHRGQSKTADDRDRYYDQVEYRNSGLNQNSLPAGSRKGHSQANRYPVEGAATYPLMGPSSVPTGPSGGMIQSYQTHVFAPVVTGAPVKKGRFPEVGDPSVQGSSAVPTSSFPATNAEGQRICRQCGMPGRYKDGKCVEKWGPGPMGPGTVCDRCRKKMKRVERRGTLESQAQAAAQAQAQAAAAAAARSASSAQLSAPPPSELTQPRDRERDHQHHHLRRVDTHLNSPSLHPHGHRASISGAQPPLLGAAATHVIIESPTSDIHHPHLSAPQSAPEESAMRTGLAPPIPTVAAGKSGNGNGETRLIKSASESRPSSRNRDERNGRSSAQPPPVSVKLPPESAESSGDADADADADGDEASSVVVENDVEMHSPRRNSKEEADPDIDLLEAVHAAEANSNRSQSSG